MAVLLVQTLAIPDVGVGPGPFPSPAWTATTIGTLTRFGILNFFADDSDFVVLLGAAVNTDPIDGTNPNIIASFRGPGLKPPELQHATACAFWALLRYKTTGTPHAALSLDLLGLAP